MIRGLGRPRIDFALALKSAIHYFMRLPLK
jgi:hypothetical protein